MPEMTTFRSVVDPSDCDFLGHMNVSRYFSACSDGVFALQSDMGLTASDMRAGRRLSFAVVNAQSDFRAELRAGDAIFMQSGILAVGGKSMTFRHRLIRADGGVVSFVTVFKCVLMNLETRSAVAIPDDVRQAAEAWRLDEAEPGAG